MPIVQPILFPSLFHSEWLHRCLVSCRCMRCTLELSAPLSKGHAQEGIPWPQKLLSLSRSTSWTLRDWVFRLRQRQLLRSLPWPQLTEPPSFPSSSPVLSSRMLQEPCCDLLSVTLPKLPSSQRSLERLAWEVSIVHQRFAVHPRDWELGNTSFNNSFLV